MDASLSVFFLDPNSNSHKGMETCARNLFYMGLAVGVYEKRKQ